MFALDINTRETGKQITGYTMTMHTEILFSTSGKIGLKKLVTTPRPVTGIALLYGDGVCFL
jgi:hypothetical protein